MSKLKVRQSNLELLRIISMILILMSHCDDIFGLFELYSTSLGLAKIVTDFLHIGGQIGVGCFVLISGYFMVEQDISLSKLLKLAGEVWFYTIGIWVVWGVHNVIEGYISIKECILEAKYAFFPILFSHYWFVTAYVILMILSPFLNKLIYALDRQYYKRFLSVLLIVFVLLKGGVPYIFSGMAEGRLMPVLVMYFIAGYIRRFGKIEGGNSSGNFVIAIVTYLLLFGTFYLFTYLGIKFNNQSLINYIYFYRGLNSPFVVVICINLFVGFLKIQIPYSKVINAIASCTFGVYLLHSNKLMLAYLPNLFTIYKETRPLMILTYSLISVLLIYVVSTLFDYIRKNSVERVWMMIVDKCIQLLQMLKVNIL